MPRNGGGFDNSYASEIDFHGIYVRKYLSIRNTHILDFPCTSWQGISCSETAATSSPPAASNALPIYQLWAASFPCLQVPLSPLSHLSRLRIPLCWACCLCNMRQHQSADVVDAPLLLLLQLSQLVLPLRQSDVAARCCRCVFSIIATLAATAH